MIETQKTISQWALETFGPSGNNASCAGRANKEMAELVNALTCDDNHPKAVEEIADVVICLYRLAERLGGDLMQAVDEKMTVNRARRWHVDAYGHGKHVQDKDEFMRHLEDNS